jgi:DNA repair exonuclease SbcCD ATPase subunit
MSKIVRFEAQNLMRLKAVEITPDGNVVVIGGKNAQGKTSVLNAIAMALGGKNEVPERPIRDGQSTGHVIVETDQFTVTRRFTAAGGSSLEVRNAQGQKLASPQTLLDSFVSKVSFDPLAFTRMKPDAQAETVRKLAGLDFSDLDAKRETKYSERTTVNRLVKDQEVRLKALPRHVDAPAKEISSAELVAELEKANAANKARDAKQESLSTLCDDVDSLSDLLGAIDKKVAELQKQREETVTKQAEVKAKLDGAKAELEAMPVIDTDPILQQIKDADEVNAKVRANTAWTTANREMLRLQTESADLTASIEQIDGEKEKLLAEATFPIEGLSFTASGVLFNGIPFEQASGAEQLRVSLAIACALNPKLPVMLIRDGSLLDDDSMKLLAEHAAKHQAQVWIEVVGKREDATVIIEDGSVAEPASK